MGNVGSTQAVRAVTVAFVTGVAFSVAALLSRRRAVEDSECYIGAATGSVGDVGEAEREPEADADAADVLVNQMPSLLTAVATTPTAAALREPLEASNAKFEDEAWKLARYEPLNEIGERLQELSQEGAKAWDEVLLDPDVVKDLVVSINRLNKPFWDDAAEFAAVEAGCGG
eukprot:TRINITY_DN21030_c0_g2_i1.p1 TRINITY_DN21030_c0_g2~~TRINITY_DN21030_c0_g2_i1.p1  ORF type:complete len:189 (-),score=45.45 TRINITY_DN21030_c0_g2_i1:232-747(-)